MVSSLQTMSVEQLFGLAGNIAMVGWFILVFLPRRYALLFAVPQYIIPFTLSLLYAGLIMSNIYTVDGGGYGAFDQVRALMSKDEVLLAGWVHYLAFDLFVGAWIARQADALGIPRIIQALLLVATLMFGPIGLALFLVMRTGFRRRMAPVEEAAS